MHAGAQSRVYRRVVAMARHLQPSHTQAIEPSELPQAYPPLPSPLDDKQTYPSGEEDVVKEVILAERTRTYHTLLESYSKRYGKGGNFWVPRMFVQRGQTKEKNKYTVIKLVVIHDVADAKRLLKKHIQKSYMQAQMFFGRGLLGIDDNEQWRRDRQLLKPVFSGRAITSLMPVMRAGADRLCASLREAATSGETVDLYELLHHEAFLIIGNSTVGEESEWLSSNADRMKQAFVAAGVPGFERTEAGKEAAACLHEFTTNVLERAKIRAASKETTTTASQSASGAGFVFAENSVAAKLLSKNSDGSDAVSDSLVVGYLD